MTDFLQWVFAPGEWNDVIAVLIVVIAWGVLYTIYDRFKP